jgi:hypothetical protein
VNSTSNDWLNVSRESLSLHDFAARHYVLQPPLFKCQASKVREQLQEVGRAVVFLDDEHELFFGFPDLSTSEALLRAMQLRRLTSARIEVGAKANPRYDSMFASLVQHIGDESLPRLFNGAVAFTSLEAYVSVYAERPTRLLQPTLRVRMGYASFPVPSAEEHQRFTEALLELGAQNGDA